MRGGQDRCPQLEQWIKDKQQGKQDKQMKD